MPNTTTGLEAADRAESGWATDPQATRARELVEAAGQPFEYRSFPAMPHSMHGTDAELFARTVTEWAATLPA